MNSFRIKDLRFRILKGGKIGLVASLMMFGVMFQTNSNAATIVNEGNGGTGIFVGETYSDYSSLNNASSTSDTNLSIGNSNDTTIFTGYYTEGGAGSGGGAGLGGVFFVDDGSTLTLNNTIFKFNTVKGGEGGSLPAQVIENTTVNLSQFSLDLTAFEAQSITPTLVYDNATGEYSFTTINVGTGTSLLNNGSNITFSELTGSNTGTISSVTSSAVTLSSAITIDSNDIETITNDVSNSTGFSISGKVVTMDYINNLSATDTTLVQQIKDNITYNGQISFRNSDGTVEVKKVTNVTYDTSGNITSFELDSVLSSLTFDPASTSLDIIPITKFETKPYVISGNTITLTGSTRGFKEGMIIYDEDGNSTGVKITSVSSDGKTLTVDNASALSSLDSITAKETPFLSDTQIKLSSPNSDLIGATSININGTDYSIDSYDNSTGIVTLSSPIDSTVKSDVESYDNPLVIKIPTVSFSGNTITLSDDGQTFSTGMKLDGTDLSITNVTTSNGKIILTLDGSTSSLSADTKILAVDTLSTGGSMNNLASTGTTGSNGGNGHDANYYSSFFNGGEGQAGTRGYAAEDGVGAAGGNGGNGGNGSDGLPVNPQLMSELYGATGDFAEAVTALAGSIAPDGAIPTPDYADIAGNVVAVSMASVDLATAIANTVFWAQNLNNGIAGMGGEGGAGGAGGNGDEFFGGGAGGAGGNGGDGALSFTDGGNGGDGGSGGDAGFGAGGGMGGAGGTAGSTGGAEDGGAGDGGLAGFGGGNGSNGDGLYGDGGSGFGGAIFVRNNGTLNITGNALFEDNMAMAGSSNNGGSAGESAGNALFMMKGSTVNLMPGFGNVITFNDGIADDSSASYDGASYAPGAGADIHISGNGGLVEFNAQNTYTGKTIIESATLSADLGVGIHNNSRIIFNGTGTSATTSATTYSDSLSLGSTGTLLLDENLTSRRVGNSMTNVSWQGSGGFASGITSGIVVNFGQISAGIGQVLTWGTNGFFQGATDKILTFGSEYSLGAVEFQNDVNIGTGSTDIARVAVYNTNLTNNTNSSTAILSGDWIGNELLVGESDNYDGNLILTGNNQLNKLTILDGTTTTSGSGKISDSDTNTIVKMYGGKLVLANSETLDTVTVNNGALLISNGNLTVNNGISNDGQILVNTGTFEEDIINNGQFANGGNITVNANIVNDNITDSTTALWNQIGTITANNLTNNGTWQQQANITLTSQLINDGTWYSGQQQIVNNVASWVDYEDSAKNTITLATLTGNGTFNIDNGDLEINQSGTSTFDGDITGQGAFTKSGTGTLRISDAQTFTGGLDVTGGTFQTLAGGTLANNLDIHVFEDSTFIAGAIDEVGSVLIDSDGTFTMNANISTQGDFTNNGLLNLNANLTTLNTDSSTNTDGDFINNGTTTLTADRTITTVGGLVGATSGIINVNNSGTTLTLVQSGDTTYSGKIQGAGNFVKDGNGNLTLNGAVGNIDLDEGTIVNDGTLTTTLANVFAADQDITVNADGTLHIKTGSQSVDTITNSGTVNLDDDLTVRVLTNNASGTFNQNADITATDTTLSAIMNGIWNVTGGEDSDTRVLNTTTLTGDATVTLVDYLDTASNLKINQSGTSTFDGDITGQGAFTKSGTGTLRISDAQTFTGGLDVTGGTFQTLAGGTLANNLDIHVFEDSTFIAGAIDEVGSVLIDSDGTFTMNANISTQGDFTNNGTLALTDNRTLTTTGGLKGSGDIEITNIDFVNPTGLTLNQIGNTTYSGTITGTGGFTKIGSGTLTLNGVAGSVDLDSKIIIDNGILALDGAYILANTSDVLINNNGTMQLINGDQEIDALEGTGLIDLGTANKLVVNQGGNFSGRVIGTGTLDIVNGDFQIDDDITSDNEDTSFNVGSGATTTITQDSTLTFPTVDVQGTLNVDGTTQASTVTVQGSGAQLNVNGTVNTSTVTVQDAGTLNVGGTIDASNSVIVYEGATLHLENGGNIETDTASIYGVLNGIGSISGDTTVYSGGTLRPGNSPGTITFDSLTLSSGSVVDMEINDSGIAGVDFDQITSNSTLDIQSGSTLNIIKYDGGSLAAAEELSMGETIKLFNFSDGNVSGKFDTINSTYTNDVIFNIASGEVIGLGGLTSNEFLTSVAQTQNQKTMIDDLNIDNEGNVEQFYGGNLLSRLASAYGNSNETNRIFNLASPEAYASLMDQTRLGLANSIVKIPANFEDVKEGLTVNTTYDSKSTSNSSEWTEYDMKNKSVRLEYTHLTKDTVLTASFSQNDKEIDSNYMSSDTIGYDMSLGIAKEMFIPGFSLRGNFAYIKDKNDLTRQTYTTDSTANDVNSDGIIGGLGVGYTKDYNTLTFDFSANASYYKANVDSFVENNANKLDSLSVEEQTKNGMLYQGKASVSTKVTEKLQLQTGLNTTYMPNSDDFGVKARVSSEQTMFNVENPGLGEVSIGVEAGLKYKIEENMSLSIDASINEIDKSNNGYNTNLSFTYKF